MPASPSSTSAGASAGSSRPSGRPEPPPPAAFTTADPHAVASVTRRLDAAEVERCRGALAVLSVLLRPGERVEEAFFGAVDGATAVVALTTDRLVLASDRLPQADAVEFPRATQLQIQGWQNAETATVVVSDGSDSVTVAAITDRGAAQRLTAAQRAEQPGGD